MEPDGGDLCLSLLDFRNDRIEHPDHFHARPVHVEQNWLEKIPQLEPEVILRVITPRTSKHISRGESHNKRLQVMSSLYHSRFEEGIIERNGRCGVRRC